MNRDDVLVVDGSRRPGLAQEALAAGAHEGQLAGHDLDGDVPLQGRVERLEHDPHAPTADDFEHLVRAEAPEMASLAGRVEEIERELAAVAGFVAGCLQPRRLGRGAVQDCLQRRLHLRPPAAETARQARPQRITGIRLHEGLAADFAPFEVVRHAGFLVR